MRVLFAVWENLHNLNFFESLVVKMKLYVSDPKMFERRSAKGDHGEDEKGGNSRA